MRRWRTNSSRSMRMMIQFSSDQFSHSVVSDSLRPHESQHARPPCPSPTPGVYWDSCPSSWWCHPVISSSVVPISCPQVLPSIRVFSNESTLWRMMIKEARISWDDIDREQLTPLGGVWTLLFSMSPGELKIWGRAAWSTLREQALSTQKHPKLLEQKIISDLGRHQEVKCHLKFQCHLRVKEHDCLFRDWITSEE